LTVLFLLNQVVQFGIVIREGNETSEFLSVIAKKESSRRNWVYIDY
jgi:hypothetical protein